VLWVVLLGVERLGLGGCGAGGVGVGCVERAGSPITRRGERFKDRCRSKGSGAKRTGVGETGAVKETGWKGWGA